MGRSFTKREAASLLGSTVECKKDVLFSYEEIAPNVPPLVLFGKGSQADVVLIDQFPEDQEIFVSLLVDDDYLRFNKFEFQSHCIVVG